MSGDRAPGTGPAAGDAIDALARRLLALCRARGITLATAESCTGGMVAAALTAVPGSSAVVDRGFVTYSNAAKHEMLGVSLHTLATHGAVSAETAREMAGGALQKSAAALTIAITGIAGPTGGSPEKPVGLVWFGIGETGSEPRSETRLFPNEGRDAIRLNAARTALELAIAALESRQPAGAP